MRTTKFLFISRIHGLEWVDVTYQVVAPDAAPFNDTTYYKQTLSLGTCEAVVYISDNDEQSLQFLLEFTKRP